MNGTQRKEHWENIYHTREFSNVSWYQRVPNTSLRLVNDLNLEKSAEFIDVGCGESYLIDHLQEMGYQNITALDISEEAIAASKARMSDKDVNIDWIVSDITEYQPEHKFDIWHDRAAFHFLNEEELINKYVQLVNDYVKPGGYLILGTFSTSGPTKCSGIDITQYSEESLTDLFFSGFEPIKCFSTDHITPKNIVQNFIFCVFKKR